MVIPDEGKLKLAYWQFGTDGSDLPNFTLHLYDNDYTPDDDTTASDFTEATFTGYAAIAILRSEFGAPAIIAHVAYITRTPVPSFECTAGGPDLVYGWYLLTDDDDTVIAAQRFDVPRSMSAGAEEFLDPFRIGTKTLE